MKHISPQVISLVMAILESGGVAGAEVRAEMGAETVVNLI